MMPLVSEDSGRGDRRAAQTPARANEGSRSATFRRPGVSYAYISRIEAGARTPSVKALRKLSQKLGVSVEYLETGRDIREVDDRELRLADAELELRLAGDTRDGGEEAREDRSTEARAAGDIASATRAAIAPRLRRRDSRQPSRRSRAPGDRARSRTGLRRRRSGRTSTRRWASPTRRSARRTARCGSSNAVSKK